MRIIFYIFHVLSKIRLHYGLFSQNMSLRISYYIKDQHDIIEESRGQRTQYEECKREIKELSRNLCAKDLEIIDLNAEMCSIQSNTNNLARCLDKEQMVHAEHLDPDFSC